MTETIGTRRLDGYAIRPATAADVHLIAEHRQRMFEDMGHHDAAALASMRARFAPWLAERLARDEYLGWIAETARGEPAASAGLWLMPWLPHMVGASDRRGNIVNVYTLAAHRRRGLARRLMDTILAWCGAHGVDVVILHASAEGRGLYEALGFRATNEMRRILPE